MIYSNTTGKMTVGDLIKELKKLPEDMKVLIYDNGEFRDVALWKTKLKQRKQKNGFWDSANRLVVNTFVNANDSWFAGDSEPEDVFVLTARNF